MIENNITTPAAAPFEMFIAARKKAIPLFASFELTPRCNFDCRMCYVHLKDSEIATHGRELNADEWISLGRQAMQNGTLFLCITGGEPTRHPEFCKIYSELSKMGFVITLQSNLYRFSDECIELLTKIPPQSIKFTIYGASNETYRKICGVNDGFQRVCKNIDILKTAGIHLEAVTVITQDNADDLAEISKMMNDLKIPWTSSADLKKSVRGSDSKIENQRLPDSAYPMLCEDVKSVLQRGKEKKILKPCEKCKEYRMGFWIKWDGKMSFCSFLNEPDIDAVSLGFSEAWKQLVEYEESLQWPVECQKCRWFDVCPRCAATLATESGSVNEINPDFCQYIDRILRNTIGG